MTSCWTLLLAFFAVGGLRDKPGFAVWRWVWCACMGCCTILMRGPEGNMWVLSFTGCITIQYSYAGVCISSSMVCRNVEYIVWTTVYPKIDGKSAGNHILRYVRQWRVYWAVSLCSRTHIKHNYLPAFAREDVALSNVTFLPLRLDFSEFVSPIV